MIDSAQTPRSTELTFSLPPGGVDAIVATLAAEDPAAPAFVYERIDPFSREPLTTWIGLTVRRRRPRSAESAYDALRDELREARADGAAGGVFAFVAYPDAPDRRPTPAGGLLTPDEVLLGLIDYIRIDHREGTARVIHVGEGGEQQVRAWAELCARAVSSPLDTSDRGSDFGWTPAVSEQVFADAVTSFQSRSESSGVGGVVLSVPVTSTLPSEPVSSYRTLRSINPSTCMFLVQTPGFGLWGATSLSLAEVRDRYVVAETDGATHPIPELPDGEEYEWVPSAKEISEYDVVADALWEDLAPISAPGTERFTREREKRVFFRLGHLFAEVQADIADGFDEVSVVQALSPHGAAVGHPRPAAMAMIAELETVPRGPFAGMIGVFETDGATDAAAVTRSMWSTPEGSVVHAGAKVVPASVPREEYEESVLKTLALRQSARPLVQGD
ncbi:chorismate-binding protein [Microbacterium sp. Y-01]|uniref:chorismate-binding protein n=1 Tax=Microbacterium sp. Y-01 TaxID=2048898 RepID=UPI0013DDF2C4|nr:chorismate-binding protein [Microbacterium sp. Y-01]